MGPVTKFFQASLASLSGSTTYRPALALLGLDKVWDAASPIIAKGCLAAMAQPSPTTGFVVGVALEIGRQLLLNCPAAIRLGAAPYRPARWIPCLPARSGDMHTLNDDMEVHDEHAGQ